jgi:hypothetical protein
VCLNPTLLGHATLRWTLMDGWTFPVPIWRIHAAPERRIGHFNEGQDE